MAGKANDEIIGNALINNVVVQCTRCTRARVGENKEGERYDINKLNIKLQTTVEPQLSTTTRPRARRTRFSEPRPEANVTTHTF